MYSMGTCAHTCACCACIFAGLPTPRAIATYHCLVAGAWAVLNACKVPAAFMLTLSYERQLSSGTTGISMDAQVGMDASTDVLPPGRYTALLGPPPAVGAALLVLLVLGTFTLAIAAVDGIALLIVIGSKWLVISQRQPGKHDQIRSDQTRSDQIRSDQIRSDQIKSDQIRSDQRVEPSFILT